MSLGLHNNTQLVTPGGAVPRTSDEHPTASTARVREWRRSFTKHQLYNPRLHPQVTHLEVGLCTLLRALAKQSTARQLLHSRGCAGACS